MSRESSVKRKSGSQTSLSKKDSKNQSETKRLIQEETVEQGSVSGFFRCEIFPYIWIFFDGIFFSRFQKQCNAGVAQLLLYGNNNDNTPFNSPLSRTMHENQYQKKTFAHSLLMGVIECL